jgi:hypothetical protein
MARAGRASQRHAREAGRERSRVTRFGHDQLAAVLVQRSLLRERADAQHDTVEYGSEGEAPKKVAAGLGDPITVGRETRPTTKSIAKWAAEMADDPTKLAQARQILDRLLDEDLETWGYPRAGIVAQLDAVTPSGARKKRPWNRYALERRLLVRLRKNIHHNAFGRLVRRIRFVCEVLLR